MERTRRLRLTRRRHVGAVPVLCLGAAFMLAGCRAAAPSFGAMLARIDASPAEAGTALWESAARLASSTDERLRLLKRASGRGADLYSTTASAVISAGPVSEPVGLAALDAFLGAGRFAEALALFDGPLDPSARAGEYAESLVLASRAGVSVDQPTGRLVACADVLGEPRFIVLAAVQAMASGDRATAATLLADSAGMEASPGIVAGGFEAPVRLLWDSGAIRVLADRNPDRDDPLDMSLCADASYLLGRRAEATAMYASIIERFPSWSWKPYAMLARAASAQAGLPEAVWPYASAPDSYAALSSPSAMADALLESMEEHFFGSPELALERARLAMARDLPGLALELAASVGGEAGALARLEYGPRERAVPDAMRLVSDYGDSPAAFDAALAALAGTGAWDRFMEVLELAGGRGFETGRSWFWRAAALVLDGDVVAAAETVRKHGPVEAGYSGAFDLGILEFAAGRSDRAEEALTIAAGLAASVHERSAALLLVGDVNKAYGRLDRARSAWEAALGVDPESRLARSRLERLEAGQ